MKLSKARNRAPHGPRVKFDMRCSCGSSIKGTVSPSVHAMKVRDIFLSFHRDCGCSVTDKSIDIEPEAV
jgi:hypothetical protein